MCAGVKQILPAYSKREARSAWLVFETCDYWSRQSALVRARMPMKAGTKTVRAAKVVTIASYIL